MNIDVYPNQEMLSDPNLTIVDIRTKGEWQQTGVLDGSKCVTFFDNFGHYDAQDFLQKMDELGGKGQRFGLICRTGSRTHQVAHFMHQQGYSVQSLSGGIMRLAMGGVDLVPYQAKP